MNGTVSDTSGALVARATVTVTNIRTNISVKTETDDAGFYVIPSLRPGEYSVTAESAGFSKIVRTGVTLQVAQVARIDVTLQPGALSETVEVVGATSLLDTRHLLARPGDRPEEDRRAAAERPRLQPARPALARRAARHAAAGQRQLQGGAQRQRQPHLQQRLPARRRGQHLLLELVSRRERPARAAVDRSAAGIQDSDERLFGRVRAQLRRGRQRHDQVRHQRDPGKRLRVPAQRQCWMRTTSSRTRSARRNRSGSATSSARRSAARSSRTARSGSATTRGCAITRASRASAWCRRPRKRRACSAPWSSIRSRPGARPSARTRRASGSSRASAGTRSAPPSSRSSRIRTSNSGGQPIYASTPVTDTRQDQFDVRIDHQFTTNLTIFGRYSFVDTLTFRPAPLPGLAEGSFNDAFGANDNRSQGLALGVTWTISPTFVGDIRFGASRGDYYTNPPNFGVDGAAEVGLKNVPNDPAIVGGVPKVNIQGFDAVGRHTSTPQFQTPRTWNPRATFSLNRGAHFIKFGGEFLEV